MKRAVIIIALVLCLCVFGVAGYHVWSAMADNQQGRQLYEDLAAAYVSAAVPAPETAPPSQAEQPAAPQNSAAPGGEEEEEAPVPHIPPPITVDFDALTARNPRVLGWLYSEGTVINYPVIQGDDNSYYLKHLLDDTYNDHGTLFVDCNNKTPFKECNTIIYGHNMDDGTMFASLDSYAAQSYYEEHKVLWLLTPGQNYQIEVFAGYTTTDASPDAYRIFSGPGEELDRYVEERIGRSDFTSGVKPKADDLLVMLSTCTYSFQNARYVLHGILHPC